MINNSVLEINSLSVSFNNNNSFVKVVDDVSFEVKQGEILGIVGESGSGKSMTALVLMGLCPKSAKIETENGIFFNYGDDNIIDISKLNEKNYRNLRGKNISMIFQEPMTSLNPVHKCGKQVEEVLKIHKIGNNLSRKKKVLDLFQDVLIREPEKIYNSFPHQLSGGQRQRVMIAMALACEPKLLIADEPTTALDVTVQKSILNLIKDLQRKKNMSVIFVSHDLGVITEICDRVVVMYKGKIVEKIETKHLFEKAKHPYTIGLMACKPPINSRPLRLPIISEFLENKDFNFEKKTNLTQREIYNTDKILVDVKNLSTYFPLNKSLMGNVKAWYKAVDDVSFQIFKGETLGLVGESGCGKTSLSRTMLRLIEAHYGDIFYENENILKYNKWQLKKLRSKVQIIFQDPYSSLNPLMTVGSALIEVMSVHKILNNFKQRKDYVLEILNKVGLSESDFLKYPHQFSGGQRQRVVIARALVVQPEFIICDEAVSALDVSVQAQVLNLLNKLKEDFNLTYLFITHDLAVVKYMSDRILVMQKGKIVESGQVDQLFYNPKTEYTKKLISSIAGFNEFVK